MLALPNSKSATGYLTSAPMALTFLALSTRTATVTVSPALTEAFSGATTMEPPTLPSFLVPPSSLDIVNDMS